MNLKALLLDLDGTLADSLSVMKSTYKVFLEQHNRLPTDAEFDLLNGPPIATAISYLKGAHALIRSEEQLLKNYVDILDQHYASVKPNDGAFELLQKAKKNQCIIGVVTSNTRKRTQSWLKNVSLAPMIDFIVSGEEVTQGKPHPEPYLIASQKTSYPIEQIVAIEDSLQGTQSATEAGLKTYALYKSESIWPKGVETLSSLFQAAEKLFS